MTNEERRQAIEDRLDTLLEKAPDNPIYEDHDSRSIYNYLQCLRLLQDEKNCIEEKGVRFNVR